MAVRVKRYKLRERGPRGRVVAKFNLFNCASRDEVKFMCKKISEFVLQNYDQFQAKNRAARRGQKRRAA